MFVSKRMCQSFVGWHRISKTPQRFNGKKTQIYIIMENFIAVKKHLFRYISIEITRCGKLYVHSSGFILETKRKEYVTLSLKLEMSRAFRLEELTTKVMILSALTNISTDIQNVLGRYPSHLSTQVTEHSMSCTYVKFDT